MWVVKLGGSLATSASIQQWLDVLACHGSGNVVLVPGGGPFARQVRALQSTWQFDDRVAHRMALLAMEQYGWMLLGLRGDLIPAVDSGEIESALNRAQVPVWLPSRMALEDDKLPANWEVTSDSLAAWLALRLKAEHLILVKSAPVDAGIIECKALQDEGVVDRAFSRFVRRGAFRAWICHGNDSELFRLALYSGVVAGTRVDAAPAGARRRPASARSRSPKA